MINTIDEGYEKFKDEMTLDEYRKAKTLAQLAQLLFKGPYSLSQPIEGLQPMESVPESVIYYPTMLKYEQT